MDEDSRALWPKASALFDQALDLPPEKRAAFLDQACAADGDLRRQMLDVLEADDRAGGFLEHPLHSQSAAVLKQVADRLRSEMRSRSPESQETRTAEAGETPRGLQYFVTIQDRRPPCDAT